MAAVTASVSEFVSVVVSDGSQRRRSGASAAVATAHQRADPSGRTARLVAAAGEVGARDDIAAVILFGGHEIFSAGDDMRRTADTEPAEAGVAAGRGAQTPSTPSPRSRNRPSPRSPATRWAAGLTLALAADWRVSGDNVKFGATEILAGLIPGGDGMARLTRAGRRQPGQGAGVQRTLRRRQGGRSRLGLIDEMVAPDDVYDAAADWARRFVGRAAAGAGSRQGGDQRRFRRRLGAGTRRASGRRRRRYVEVFAAGQALADAGDPGGH